MNEKIITVTAPVLPPLEELIPLLEDIWKRKWLTNNGHYHQALEKELSTYLNVPYISLVANGTLALILALRLTGEVITTPYSFVATAHSLVWNNLTPVFVDVDPVTLNLDPSKIEAAVTPRTSAVLAVHVYGTTCDTVGINSVAESHGLKVIYDAAHSFAVEEDGESILNHGDMSILSFHATKPYSTIEGGAVVSRSPEMKDDIDRLKNFGISNEVNVIVPGMNAKLNELQAAYGLVCLKHFDRAKSVRKHIAEYYRKHLGAVVGISYLKEVVGVKSNYSYFPIFVDKARYGHSRDELYGRLKEQRIFGRRYFYPLISDFPPYRDLPSADRTKLPIAATAADQVICLPLHGELDEDDAKRIVELVQWKGEK
jgi:dTDP-4-amino-4,6-dideoxygalactose transaminase